MIPFDYHSHHYRCGHATGTMRDYIESARSKGLTTFGVSDHGPAYFMDGVDHAFPQTQMAVSELPRYVAEARELQTEYADRIAVRVGLEADFILERAPDLAVLLEADPLDYVLGSVHYVLGKSVFDRARWRAAPAEPVWRAYYQLVIEAAESGLFDILSHLTVVEAYSPPLPPELADELYVPVADAIGRAGCAVEVNTSGYRKMGGDEPFPNRRMLRHLIGRGVPLTFGSDSHKPDQVAWGRERVESLLAELGVDTSTPSEITLRRGPVRVFPTA